MDIILEALRDSFAADHRADAPAIGYLIHIGIFQQHIQKGIPGDHQLILTFGGIGEYQQLYFPFFIKRNFDMFKFQTVHFFSSSGVEDAGAEGEQDGKKQFSFHRR